MYNGAWDYPADTRGYTWGWVHELHMRRWSVRYASAAMRKWQTGCASTAACFATAATKWKASRASSSTGAREQSALAYQNHADMGAYADALRLAAPDRRHAGRDRHASGSRI